MVNVVTVDPELVVNRGPVDRGAELEAELDFTRTLTGHRLRVLVPDLFGHHHATGRTGPRPSADDGQSLSQGLIRPAMSRAGWSAVRRFALPDGGIGWIPSVLDACASLRPGSVDVVMASGNPWSGFVAARRLARRLGAGLVLDYRDPWTTNAFSPKPPASWVAPFLERSLGRSADLIVTTAASHAATLERCFGFGDKTLVITNGYSDALAASVVPADLEGVPVVYAGTVDSHRRSLAPVLRALAEVNRRSGSTIGDVVFHYFGADGAAAGMALAAHAPDLRWVDHGYTRQDAVLGALKAARFGIVLTSDTPVPETPAKVFDHIGASCPTLLVSARDSDAAQIIESVGIGLVVPHRDQAGMVDAVESLLTATGPRRIDPAARLRYGWKARGETLHGALCKVIGR